MNSFRYPGILARSLLLLALVASWVAVAPSSAFSKPVLVISTYDSLASKSGLGGKLFPLFEKTCDCTVKISAAGDAGTIASRLELEARRGKLRSHVILGFDELLWPRIKPHVDSFQPKGLDTLLPEIRTGVTAIPEGFVPFDHGIHAFIQDTQLSLAPPRNLADLKDARFTKKLLLQDPRTSTPGLGFLFFTRERFGRDWSRFWSDISGQWLTLASGWDQAYGMFLKGEAPLVWSYTTSQAYHRLHGDPDSKARPARYHARIFEDAMPIQVEGAALVRGLQAEERRLAERFLEFLISPEAQALIPEGNWMLPVRKGVALPAVFAELPKPLKWIHLRADAGELKEVLAQWNRALQR